MKKVLLSVGLVTLLALCGCQQVTKEFCALEAPKRAADESAFFGPVPPPLEQILLFTMTVDDQTKEFYGPPPAGWKDGKYQIGYRSIDVGKAAHLEDFFVNFDIKGDISVSYSMTTPMKYTFVPVWPGPWADVKFSTFEMPPNLPPPMPPGPEVCPQGMASVKVTDTVTSTPGFFWGQKDSFTYFIGTKLGGSTTYLDSGVLMLANKGGQVSDIASTYWGQNGTTKMALKANYRISAGDKSWVAADFLFVPLSSPPPK